MKIFGIFENTEKLETLESSKKLAQKLNVPRRRTRITRFQPIPRPCHNAAGKKTHDRGLSKFIVKEKRPKKSFLKISKQIRFSKIMSQINLPAHVALMVCADLENVALTPMSLTVRHRDSGTAENQKLTQSQGCLERSPFLAWTLGRSMFAIAHF